MNNVLLINPRGAIQSFGSFVDREQIKCYVVTTSTNRNFLTEEQSKFYDCYTPDSLPGDLKFVSAISSDVLGFKFLEKLNNNKQIYLSNPTEQSSNRLKTFLIGQPTESCTMYETFSFYGRHVIASAWKYNFKYPKGTFDLIDPALESNWEDQVDNAFEALENVGYINGPAQIFFNKDNKLLGIKYQMAHWIDSNLALRLTGRSWLSHWPAVLKDPNNNDKGFFKRYYEWSRSINNRKYQMLESYSVNES